MRKPLSCHPADAPATRSTRRATLLASLATLVALGVGPMAAAVTLPPWMQSRLGVPLPEHDAETGAVALYSETSVTVSPNGKILKTQRAVYRILRTEGAKRALVRADFDAQSRIMHMHGWSVSPEGRPYEVSEKDSVESALIGVLHGELMGDLRSKVLRIPAAVPSSTVGYEVEEELQPYALMDDWTFQDTIPVREAHYSLELPPGWRYKATWVNHGEQPAIQVGPTHWQWQIQDVNAIAPELQMPPMAAIAGRLAVALLPPNDHETSFQSWRELGTWYQNLTLDRRTASPDIQKKVAELSASAPTALGKIQALSSFVQTDIRYVAIELGIGGLQPHSATEVFTHRYGDCKDKVTLLSAMLKEIGVDSHYLIVNTMRGVVTESAPVGLDFNHVILAIQLPHDAKDPALLATVAHAKLGRLLLFDPTDGYTPLGQLAGPLQGGYGLLVTPDGGELIKVPELPPSANAIQRTAHLQLDGRGQLSGDVHEVWLGDPAAAERGTLDATAQETDRIKSIESVMAAAFSTFQLTKAAIANRQASSQPLEWTYSLQVDQYAKVTGGYLTVRPRVLGSMSTGLLETKTPRHYDIQFEGPRRDTDVFEIALPEGYEVDDLPQPVDEEHSFATYHSKTEVVGHTLRYTRAFEVKSVSVPVAQADELKALYRVILNDERMPAVLRKSGQ
jgi:hypothetical protein